jgi:hypothetical protein
MAASVGAVVPLASPRTGPQFVPFRFVYEVSFGKPTSGYALVHLGSRLSVADTTDGGRH